MGAESLLNPATAILGAGEAVYGIIKGIKADKDFKNAMKQRKAYQTPKELYQLLQATQSNAQSGFDAETLNYLTTQNNNAFGSSLETLQKLGGDPNSAAALFDQQMQNILKVGAQNHALNLENFSKYLGALDTMANSKAAEWSSQQDIVKDKLQAANANKATAFKNISNGINTTIGALGADATGNLYGSKPQGNSVRSVGGVGGNTYTAGNIDPTAPPPTIIKNGVTYTWNPITQKYE